MGDMALHTARADGESVFACASTSALPDLREEALNPGQDADALLALLSESFRDLDDIGLESRRQLCSFGLYDVVACGPRRFSREGARERCLGACDVN